jgi:hypothetical protein
VQVVCCSGILPVTCAVTKTGVACKPRGPHLLTVVGTLRHCSAAAVLLPLNSAMR